jgi:hypothetical protein
MSLVTQDNELGRARAPSKGHLAWWLFAPFTVLVIYVLSAGPIVKLANKGFISPACSEKIYAPLSKLTQHNKAASRLMIWYLLDVWHALGPLRSKDISNPDGSAK